MGLGLVTISAPSNADELDHQEKVTEKMVRWAQEEPEPTFTECLFMY
jgi:hypothetical protein